MVNSLMVLIFEKRYEAYTRSENEVSREGAPIGLARADVMACRYMDESGAEIEDLIIFDETRRGRLLKCEGCFDALTPDADQYKPLKQTFANFTCLHDYVDFTRNYAEIERGKSIYKIKPEICVDYIPGDILTAALFEGSVVRNDEFDAILREISDILTKRNMDAFSRHKPAHSIFKKEAMWNLAKTGKSGDHFWGMRAYTPKERVRIFSGLLKQQRENPYIHIYFLADSSTVRDVNINYCEGAGMVILDAHTDYNLANGHANVLLSHPEFEKLFKKYMLSTLIAKYALPESETITILEDMLSYCQSLLE